MPTQFNPPTLGEVRSGLVGIFALFRMIDGTEGKNWPQMTLKEQGIVLQQIEARKKEAEGDENIS